ncbi:hypothetical protein MHYP_G00241810 [Metynnis hypsauchen]
MSREYLLQSEYPSLSNRVAGSGYIQKSAKNNDVTLSWKPGINSPSCIWLAAGGMIDTKAQIRAKRIYKRDVQRANSPREERGIQSQVSKSIPLIRNALRSPGDANLLKLSQHHPRVSLQQRIGVFRVCSE